jgi:dihydrofolate reductase
MVAADENNVIGKNNQLPWRLPNDLKYFKNQTWAMPVIMGRKTFESFGKPLPGRKNIVITRNGHWQKEGVEVVHSIEEGIKKAEAFDINEVFIIGGAQIFESVISSANRIYLTRIHHRFEGDAYFPAIDAQQWNLVKERFCTADDKNAYSHSFQVWERKS